MFGAQAASETIPVHVAIEDVSLGKSRLNGSGPVEFVFDYNRFESGADLEQNILLLPGDNIVVPEQTGF